MKPNAVQLGSGCGWSSVKDKRESPTSVADD